MLKTFSLLAGLAFLATPLTVAAQLLQPPLPPRIPPQGAPPARSDQRPGGITVSGIGQAQAAADTARVTLNLSARNNTLTLNKTTLQPVVDALVRAGVDPNSIVEPFYLEASASTNYATISGSVDHPTVQMLQDGIQTLTSAFTALPNILVNQASVTVTVNECTVLRTKARRAALEQAHAQALEIANASTVHLGKIIAVQAFGDNGGQGIYSQTPANSCSSYYQLGPGNMPFMLPADYLRVRIFSNVNVTYAIR